MNPKDTAPDPDIMAAIRKRARPETYGIKTTIRLSAEELAMVARLRDVHPELNGLAEVMRAALREKHARDCGRLTDG